MSRDSKERLTRTEASLRNAEKATLLIERRMKEINSELQKNPDDATKAALKEEYLRLMQRWGEIGISVLEGNDQHHLKPVK
jgi:seryl-tRNA synthetase